MQQPAAMPTAALVDPVTSGLMGREWLGNQADPCIGGYGTHGFTAKRSTRHLGRPST